jgi:ubiquitin C-terminal hydrolase
MKGIKNIGNTCYINCILQSLAYNQIFIDYINKHLKEIEYVINKKIDKRFIFLELYKIIKELHIDNDITSIIPTSFLKLIEQIRNESIQLQQDSSDILQLLLDHIITFFGNNYTSNKYTDISITNLFKLSNENKELTFKNQYSDFNEIFYGQKIYNITCNECHNVEILFEVFNILNVSVNNCNTLEECFDEYFKYFKADDYKCEKCKSQNVIHKYYIWELPKTLTIALKRFNNNSTKLNNLIKFSDNFSLNKYIWNYSESIDTYNNYSLYSVINHYGNLNRGHYTSIINNNNKWYVMDDDHISEIRYETVNSSDNYIIFYNMN